MTMSATTIAPAGLGRDLQVAEHLCGMAVYPVKADLWHQVYRYTGRPDEPVPAYSSDDAAAMAMLPELTMRGFEIAMRFIPAVLRPPGATQWAVRIMGAEARGLAWGYTLADALSKAALLVMGLEEARG